jgi:hypothetical protein
MPFRADRPDQRIANESGDEEAGKNIKDLVIDMIARNTFGHPRVVQIVDDHRAGDPRRRPGGEQTAMDRADVLRAEHIREIGWHSGKTAAIHGGNKAERSGENLLTSAIARARCRTPWKRRAAVPVSSLDSSTTCNGIARSQCA